MYTLAAYIMRGRVQAVLVSSTLALLSLIFIPFGMLSAASVGLVTLRHGYRDGLMVILGASLITGVFVYLSLASISPLWMFVFEYWLPLCFFCWVLDRTNSLSLTIQLAGIVAVLMVVGMHLFIGDVVAWWIDVLENDVLSVLKEAGLLIEIDKIERIAGLMTGVVTFGMLFICCSSLFIARSWQAALFNPEGFRKEFLALRFDVRLGWVTFSLVGLTFVFSGNVIAMMSADLLWIVVALTFLQGLAIVHYSFNHYQTHALLMAIFYLALIFFLPQLVIVLAVLGYTDLWLDFRKRIVS